MSGEAVDRGRLDFCQFASPARTYGISRQPPGRGLRVNLGAGCPVHVLLPAIAGIPSVSLPSSKLMSYLSRVWRAPPQDPGRPGFGCCGLVELQLQACSHTQVHKFLLGLNRSGYAIGLRMFEGVKPKSTLSGYELGRKTWQHVPMTEFLSKGRLVYAASSLLNAFTFGLGVGLLGFRASGFQGFGFRAWCLGHEGI